MGPVKLQRSKKKETGKKTRYGTFRKKALMNKVSKKKCTRTPSRKVPFNPSTNLDSFLLTVSFGLTYLNMIFLVKPPIISK